MRIALSNLLMRPNRNRNAFEVEEELQFHVEMLERKYTQQGLCIADAKAAAARRFGNFERAKQQCLDIARRNSLLQRILKASSVVIALTGLVINTLSSDYKVARMGGVLIMIAVCGRVLLYVRGLGPSSFLPGRLCTKTTHVSEWMINSNLPVANVNLEFHQRELVDRSFSLKEAVMEKSTN
jgi:hypothetical protein